MRVHHRPAMQMHHRQPSRSAVTAHATHHAEKHCAACDQAHAGAKATGPTATQAAARAKSGSGQVVQMKMYMGKGADGKVHALASNANFSVKAGQKVTLELTNVDDDMDHSFTSPGLGVDVKLPHAKDGKPTVKTVTFTASKPGKVEWYCSVPCDPKAMATNGMMRGTVTVTK